MRGFWTVVAMMGQDGGNFNTDLGGACSPSQTTYLDHLRVTANPKDLREINLSRQPSQATLEAVDKCCRSYGQVLFAYELAEVNRIVCEQKSKPDPHKHIRKYWHDLSAVATTYQSWPPFMEAVGAMAIDHWTRTDFVQGGVSLSRWFHLPNDMETALRGALPAAEQSAQDYFDDSWQGSSCLSVIQSPGTLTWFHVNL